VSAETSRVTGFQRTIGAISASAPMKDRVRVLAGINFQNVDPGLGGTRRRAARG